MPGFGRDGIPDTTNQGGEAVDDVELLPSDLSDGMADEGLSRKRAGEG
jgi:hypothetical protein